MSERSAHESSTGTRMPIIAIVAPPPTPNGDLHLGHLAGPYLGADVLRRYLTLRGYRCVSAISVDTNQTYVVTTADKLRMSPAALAQQSYADIKQTLHAADIAFDVIGMPDTAYTAYVKNWFVRLERAGAFDRRESLVPYHPGMERFLFEAYASGRCPVCLAATKANICEGCGHPNQAGDL